MWGINREGILNFIHRARDFSAIYKYIVRSGNTQPCGSVRNKITCGQIGWLRVRCGGQPACGPLVP
ncbi:uncharacterized protein NEPG_02639 [Nematocida parisii ERTm1]|uniref:uncharacterized protein n=1 Tax=Nematocida parisii (strain ERTm1 / ATCC PRA-289) TaxID=881290 RepID=UPI000264B4F6|nr:uncharacterized protein NEPG_02639 [Nematocida parisii ERTm1]EIJ92497.1 hypothetical protein NEPG_02639 [Nematocida parisii ERTm1]|eukprot:XP_013060466.1 hypothetical protein NEPG_02639 [Nematocida parisii ERTm1]